MDIFLFSNKNSCLNSNLNNGESQGTHKETSNLSKACSALCSFHYLILVFIAPLHIAPTGKYILSSLQAAVHHKPSLFLSICFLHAGLRGHGRGNLCNFAYILSIFTIF